MAKKKKGKGKRKGRRGRRKHKGTSKKHSILIEGGAVYDGAKVLLSDIGGQTLARRAMAAPFDPAQRAALIGQIKTPGSELRTALRNETKEVQFGIGAELARQWGPTHKVISKADRVVAKVLGKKWKV